MQTSAVILNKKIVILMLSHRINEEVFLIENYIFCKKIHPSYVKATHHIIRQKCRW
jgi:hypothetical protein